MSVSHYVTKKGLPLLLEGIKDTTECDSTEVTLKGNISASANNHILDNKQFGEGTCQCHLFTKRLSKSVERPTHEQVK